MSKAEPAAATAPVPASASLDRLDCYKVARDFARLAQRLPISNAVLRDQFRRASLSALTNVAEGAGRVAKADKRRCYAIARGEIFERTIFAAQGNNHGCEPMRELKRNVESDKPMRHAELLSKPLSAAYTHWIGSREAARKESRTKEGGGGNGRGS